MLHLGNKNIGILFILLLFLLSCNKHGDSIIKLEQRGNYLKSNFIKYQKIFKITNDSINKWCEDSLAVTKFITFGKWEMDSLLIFNNDSTMFFTTINKKTLFKYAEQDDLSDFAGAKINGEWYFFFMGVSEPIVRSYWQDSIYSPLSFEELSYAAYDLRFRSVVEAILNDDSVKVDQFFERKFTELPACNSYPIELKRYCQDSIILASVSGKYNYKLTQEELSEIQKAISESKIPENEPLVKYRSWWDKLRYGEKVFESKAWKDYLKNKYGSKWE